MRRAAIAVGLLAHGVALAYVVSDTEEPAVLEGIAATLCYVGALVLLGVCSQSRPAFALVLTESAIALVLGIVVGGFDNEAWGASIVLLTLVATVTLAAVAAIRTVRSAQQLRRRE